MKVLYEGAEAVVYEEGDIIVKYRKPKKYRHKELDEKIRKKRTKSETNLLKKSADITPNVLESNNLDIIKMDKIDGFTVKEVLDNNTNIAFQIGIVVSKLHELNIIHGDLTTGNLIWLKDSIKVIDLGLGKVSPRLEDKAVDLHLFKESLESKHHLVKDEVWSNFLENYNPKEKKEILKKLERVERRGRNKSK